jgi:hypothetical protein
MYNKKNFMTDQKSRPSRRPAPRGVWVLVGLVVVGIVFEVVL